jgi:ribonuclease P protein component
MLAKINRLRKDKDFANLVKSGRICYGQELSLRFGQNNLSQSRWGFVVSKKVDKRAVIRNQIKRRLRAIVRQNLGHLKSGLDIMVLTRAEIKNLTYNQLKDSFLSLLKKADLMA